MKPYLMNVFFDENILKKNWPGRQNWPIAKILDGKSKNQEILDGKSKT